MTMVPMYKKCLRCGKTYSWNPDVGQFQCPYCLGLGKRKKTLYDVILKAIKNNKSK